MNSIENRHSDIQSKIKSSEDEVISTKTRLQDGHSKIEKLYGPVAANRMFHFYSLSAIQVKLAA